MVFLWTWNPSGDDDRAAENKNGEWTASNLNMAMTNEGGDIWSFTMVPTAFYNVDAATVYSKDFSMLVKLSDGTGDGGGGCDEDKTEDLTIMVDPPPSASGVLRGFPQVAQADDVFTLIYDNSQESKETMQNLGTGEIFAYAQATVDSVDYFIATFFNIHTEEKLRMNFDNEGTFTLTFIPDEFFEGVIPQGGVITSMEFAVRKEDFASQGDKSDEALTFSVGCEP